MESLVIIPIILKVIPKIRKEERNGINSQDPFSGVRPKLKNVKGIKVIKETIDKLMITIFFLSNLLIRTGVNKNPKYEQTA
jgi:hypothetical protein